MTIISTWIFVKKSIVCYKETTWTLVWQVLKTHGWDQLSLMEMPPVEPKFSLLLSKEIEEFRSSHNHNQPDNNALTIPEIRRSHSSISFLNLDSLGAIEAPFSRAFFAVWYSSSFIQAVLQTKKESDIWLLNVTIREEKTFIHTPFLSKLWSIKDPTL